LLLKVNDEIKKISDSKPALLINSKPIEELEKVYNRSNILLSEKGTIYSNYVKTVMLIYPNKNIPPKHREKSVNNKVEKTNYKLDLNGPSYEEEVVSPIVNFIPKKINLGSKKITVLDKRYTKNNGSIQKFIENNLNDEKDFIKKQSQLNKSTIFEISDINKLIEKILSIKNNENMESIIKANIKKLRKYCYKFRIKKKKKKYKSKEPRVTKLYVGTSKNLSIKKIEKERRSTPFKIVVHRLSNKKVKHNSSLNYKRKMKKIKTLNEENGTKIINDLHDMKLQKPIKTSENISTNKTANSNKKNSHYIITINKNDSLNNNHEEEDVPDLYKIKKERMRSFINERPSKFDIHNNNSKPGVKTDKSKKNNKKKNNLKKMIMRNVSAFNPKDIEKIKFSMKKAKKEKLELEDNLNKNNNNNNTHKNYVRKSENKKMNNINIIVNNSFNHRCSNYSKVKKGNESKMKSKKKLIESPNRKIDNYSNCNTNYNTNNNFTLTQSSNEKICKYSKKKV
jgi:hypothetical protein